MKICAFLLATTLTLLSIGCTTGATALKLSEVPKDNGIFFGHIDFYNGEDRIDGSSLYRRCFVGFKNEQGKTIHNASMDKSSWVFGAAPVGRIYLSGVICNVGFLNAHPELRTHDLSFPIVDTNPTYFGHLTIRFNFHGIPALNMFGLVGASLNALNTSGSKDQTAIEIENQIDEAKLEYQKRYSRTDESVKIIDAVIEKPSPNSNPTKM